jgi:LysM repeat protein
MSRIKFTFSFFVLYLFVSQIFAQSQEVKITRDQYINTYKDIAIKEMLIHGVPASIKLAQAILESSDGNSALAKEANNHFGIKCHAGWEGNRFIQDDDAKDECFRVYERSIQSFIDHTQFLKTRRWYAPLFELDRKDYKAWAYGLKKAGYATNPKYPELLIGLIEKHNLHQYDLVSEMPNISYDIIDDKSKKEVVITEEPKAEKIEWKSDLSVKSNNDIKFVYARKDDTPYKISKELKMMMWQIYKYNDLNKKDQLKEGDIVYLQPKRNKSKKVETHKVNKGETLKMISQKYGVKLNKLELYNPQIKNLSSPNQGDIIYLSRKGLRERKQ